MQLQNIFLIETESTQLPSNTIIKYHPEDLCCLLKDHMKATAKIFPLNSHFGRSSFVMYTISMAWTNKKSLDIDGSSNCCNNQQSAFTTLLIRQTAGPLCKTLKLYFAYFTFYISYGH